MVIVHTSLSSLYKVSGLREKCLAYRYEAGVSVAHPRYEASVRPS